MPSWPTSPTSTSRTRIDSRHTRRPTGAIAICTSPSSPSSGPAERDREHDEGRSRRQDHTPRVHCPAPCRPCEERRGSGGPRYRESQHEARHEQGHDHTDQRLEIVDGVHGTRPCVDPETQHDTSCYVLQREAFVRPYSGVT